METIGISQFKSQTLKVLDRVAKTHEGIVITKRGKPVAQVLPINSTTASGKMGGLADTLLFENDLVTPLDGGVWECTR